MIIYLKGVLTVSLKEYSREQLESMSMLELASKILKDEKKALDFQELYSRITDLKGFSEEGKEDYIAQFYTDLNVDGRFTTLGSNKWGLKRWYPIEQAEEEVHAPKKKKKKKAAKKKKPAAEEVHEEEELEVHDEKLHDDHNEDVTDDYDEDLDDENLDELDEDLDDFDDFDEEELDDEDIDEEFNDDEDDDKEEKDK